MERLGIFGGTFDPLHNGHLFVAEAVREVCALDRVLFVPTRAGNHKGVPSAPAQDRAAMVRVAIASNPAFALDESDLADDATGYTADLLPRLRKRYPGDAFTFIVGADSLVRSRWERLDEVIDALDGFVVAPRPDIAQHEVEAAFDRIAGGIASRRAKFRTLDTPLLLESSTRVRERIAAGRSIRYLVPEPVYRYVVERELYRATVAP